MQYRKLKMTVGFTIHVICGARLIDNFKCFQTSPSKVFPTTLNANSNLPDVQIKNLKSLDSLFFQLSSNPSASSLDSISEI